MRNDSYQCPTVAALASALLLAAAAVGGAETTSAPATAPAGDVVVVKTREKVSFALADPAATMEGTRYTVARVVKDAAGLARPGNMKLDEKTGKFSWEPTESQAGAWVIDFAIILPPPRIATAVARRVTVRPGPIIDDRGKLGNLLRKWYADGSAAGNTGDFYDNRDRRHSHLNMKRYPQLDKVIYPEAMIKRRLDWALQTHFVFPHVTFGNSLTASGDMSWGSNPRHAMLSPGIMAVLYRQYTHAHLYIYPEHRDHDVGHNGRGGYGDLFPANTPYVITSQGSSGSDQRFMEAVASALAAFRPDTKKRLIATGLLMPAVQMVLRRSCKPVKTTADYRTGKAHPTVFESGDVDAEKMARLAHDIRANALPALVLLKVVEEDQPVAGRDYFDAHPSEKLFDTPSAIARIVRSVRRERRMVVSAANSREADKRPLKFHWAVLRGDPKRVRISPLDKTASRVELRVAWHERRPVVPGSAMESNRVHIGAFAHNGACDSAPAFVSLFYLDDEARTYADDGRILDVGYGCGDSTIGYATDNPRDGGYDIADWPGLLGLIARDDANDFAAAQLRGRLGPAAVAELAKAARELADACAAETEPNRRYDQAEQARKDARKARDEARKRRDAAKTAHAAKPTDATRAPLDKADADLKAAEAALKQAEKLRNDARKPRDKARAAARRALTEQRPRIKASAKDRVEAALNEIARDVQWTLTHAAALAARLDAAKDAARKRAFIQARDELVKMGILADDGKGNVRLSPAVDGPAPPHERLTAYERNRLEWLNIAAMRELVYPGLVRLKFRRNYVNPFLAAPKTWRDVYHYDAKGRLTGWTRYEPAGKKLFTADGALVEQTDKLGRPIRARQVRYVAETERRGRARAGRGLKCVADGKTVLYDYADDTDRLGKPREAD